MKEQKTENLNIRITPTTKKQLVELAKSENRTVSNYFENLISIEYERLQK